MSTSLPLPAEPHPDGPQEATVVFRSFYRFSSDKAALPSQQLPVEKFCAPLDMFLSDTDAA